MAITQIQEFVCYFSGNTEFTGVCRYAHLYACKHVQMYARRQYACKDAHVCMYNVRVCMNVHVHVCMDVYAWMCVFMYIHVSIE